MNARDSCVLKCTDTYIYVCEFRIPCHFSVRCITGREDVGHYKLIRRPLRERRFLRTKPAKSGTWISVKTLFCDVYWHILSTIKISCPLDNNEKRFSPSTMAVYYAASRYGCRSVYLSTARMHGKIQAVLVKCVAKQLISSHLFMIRSNLQ